MSLSNVFKLTTKNLYFKVKKSTLKCLEIIQKGLQKQYTHTLFHFQSHGGLRLHNTAKNTVPDNGLTHH